MGTQMTSRQIIDAIHDNLPTDIQHNNSVSDKEKTTERFARFVKVISHIETDPHFALNDAEIVQTKTIVHEANNIRTLLAQLRCCTTKPIWDLVKKFIDTEKDTTDSDLRSGHDEFKAMQWSRMRDRRPDEIEEIRSLHPITPEKQHHVIALRNVLLFGIHNTIYNVYALLCCTPTLYQRQNGITISPSEWEHIGMSTLPLMHTYASANEDVFEAGISWALRQKNTHSKPPMDWPGFDPWAFTLDEGMHMQLHPRIVEPTRAKILDSIENDEIVIDEERVGCPGRPIFSMLHRRVMAAASKGLFPYAEKVLSLPMEAPCSQ